ncbi:MAG TPA: Pr6Pr family membrane protein [Pseudonocardiaceae bacterium]|nr:Pr6Pr family membrane protein [Pseudonocardiaceae bacterium]
MVHRIMPVVLVLDWLIAPPARPPRPLRLPQVWCWFVFPLALCAYTLVRGQFADWYPHPFLDPRRYGYAVSA